MKGHRAKLHTTYFNKVGLDSLPIHFPSSYTETSGKGIFKVRRNPTKLGMMA